MDYQQLITFIMGNGRNGCVCSFGSDDCSGPGDGYFGVIVLGVTTAVGGGAIRDVILGIVPPAMFQNPIYTLVATITSCVVFLILYLKKELLQGHNRETYDKIMLVMDSIGLGIFTVVGVNTGISHGYVNYMFLLVFLGTITGVGGGLLRDIMAGVPPYILVKHIYACASIVGAIVCVVLYRNFGAVVSMVGASAVVILVRYLAAHYRGIFQSLPEKNSKEEI